MHVLLCIFVCNLECALKCLLEGEQQKCTNGGKTTYCILLPLQMLSNFIQMNVLRSPPDKFPRNFPPFWTTWIAQLNLCISSAKYNQSYSNFIKVFYFKDIFDKSRLLSDSYIIQTKLNIFIYILLLYFNSLKHTD